MPRYIDAEKLCELARNHINKSVDCNDIMRFPVADVQEVRHGKWQLQPVGFGYCWECSVCHMNPRFYSMENTKYCPNCGAEMDGDER